MSAFIVLRRLGLIFGREADLAVQATERIGKMTTGHKTVDVIVRLFCFPRIIKGGTHLRE